MNPLRFLDRRDWESERRGETNLEEELEDRIGLDLVLVSLRCLHREGRRVEISCVAKGG